MPISDPAKQARSIALSYLAFGVTWVVGADWLLMSSFMGRNPELARFVASIKGAVFVIISAALFFFLIRRMLAQLIKNKGAYRSNYE